MGLQVKLETFLQQDVMILAAGLLVAAIVGKVFSGFGASGVKSRMAIGIGMMPRGEVGLIFAAIGKSLGVLDDALFSAVVLMVIAISPLSEGLEKTIEWSTLDNGLPQTIHGLPEGIVTFFKGLFGSKI